MTQSKFLAGLDILRKYYTNSEEIKITCSYNYFDIVEPIVLVGDDDREALHLLGWYNSSDYPIWSLEVPFLEVRPR